MKKMNGIRLLAMLLCLVLSLATFAACDSSDGNAETTGSNEATGGDIESEGSENGGSENGDSENNETNGEGTEQDGGASDDNTPTIPVGMEVSEAEWKAAFDLTDQTGFTLTTSEKLFEDSSVLVGTFLLKYNNGKAYVEENAKREDETFEQHGYRNLSMTRLTDMGVSYQSVLWNKLRFLGDYGYSLFTYSETTRSYHTKMDLYSLESDVNIWIRDGHVVRMTIIGEDAERGKSLEGVYEYADINTTEEIVMPVGEAQVALDAAKGSILEATNCSTDDAPFAEADSSEIAQVLYDFISELEITELNAYGFENNKLQCIWISCEDAETEFFETIISYDDIALYFGDSGAISSINIGDGIWIYFSYE